MTDAYQVTGSIRYCTRGCTRPRQHATTCEDRDECPGCLPKTAEHGWLCYDCHKRFLNWIDNATAQHALLHATAEPGRTERLTAETTARIGDGWRTDSNQTHQGPHARTSQAGSEGTEPLRLACLDTAQLLEDMFAQWVEMLVADYQMGGPKRALTNAEREHGRHGLYRWREGIGDYVWTDPPARFFIGSAARWLAAQVERLEWCDDIDDMWEELGSVMSQAHALAPWRPQASRLDGIECPRCHRCALVHYGGDDFVTCTRCNEAIPPERYGIWVRELNERRAG